MNKHVEVTFIRKMLSKSFVPQLVNVTLFNNYFYCSVSFIFQLRIKYSYVHLWVCRHVAVSSYWKKLPINHSNRTKLKQLIRKPHCNVLVQLYFTFYAEQKATLIFRACFYFTTHFSADYSSLGYGFTVPSKPASSSEVLLYLLLGECIRFGPRSVCLFTLCTVRRTEILKYFLMHIC